MDLKVGDKVRIRGTYATGKIVRVQRMMFGGDGYFIDLDGSIQEFLYAELDGGAELFNQKEVSEDEQTESV